MASQLTTLQPWQSCVIISFVTDSFFWLGLSISSMRSILWQDVWAKYGVVVTHGERTYHRRREGRSVLWESSTFEKVTVTSYQCQILKYIHRPLNKGVRVIAAHCSTKGTCIDFENGDNEVPCLDVFLRMMEDKVWQDNIKISRLMTDLSIPLFSHLAIWEAAVCRHIGIDIFTESRTCSCDHLREERHSSQAMYVSSIWLISN